MVTGSIQQNQGKYYAVLNLRDDLGNRKQKWVSMGLPVKNNRRKAEKRLEDIKAQYSDDIYIAPDQTLFCDFIKDWVHASQGRLQVTTYDVYNHMLDKHLFPYFKKSRVLLSNLTPATIQKYINDKLASDLSPNTVSKHYSIIRSVLQQAVKNTLIKSNPCDCVDKPKRKKFYGEYYNADEIKALLAVAKGTQLETAIYIAAYFGLRRSEVIGLRWDAIDFSTKTLRVKHKVVRAKKDGKMATYATDDLKTESSYRTLPLDDTLVAYLQELKQQQGANCGRNGNCHVHEYNDYVCVNELGNLINPDYVTDAFSKLLKKHNFKHIRFHDLRHSCASLLLALGYSMKDVQEWLGHSNYQTTANLYGHVDPNNKRDMIQGITGAIGLVC